MLSHQYIYTLLLIVLAGCGTTSSNLPTIRNVSNPENAEIKKNITYSEIDGILILDPSPTHYSKQLQKKMKLAQDNIPEKPSLIFLNFNGAIMDNSYLSSVGLNCADSFHIPPSGLTTEQKSRLLEELQLLFDFNIQFTTTEPNFSTFSTVQFGGKSQLLDCDNLPDTSALAAQDEGNLFSTDVAFVFESTYSSSLSHTKTVVDAITGAGGFEFSINDQLTVEQVQRYLNISLAIKELKESETVDISPLGAQQDTFVPVELRPLSGLDKVVTVLAIAGNEDGRLSIPKARNVLGNLANAPTTGILVQIATAAGVPELSVAIDLAKLIFRFEKSDQEIISLPSFDDFLELSTTSYSLKDLIRKFETHNLFLEMNYQNQPELRTLAIIAFLQAMPKAFNG